LSVADKNCQSDDLFQWNIAPFSRKFAKMPAADNAANRSVVRKLRWLGVDVVQLAIEPLPDELWEVIANVIRGVSGKQQRWYAAAAMYGRFIEALKAGRPAAELAEQFAGGRTLAPLMQRPDMRELVLGANLTGQFNVWLADVVRRTRLNRREKLAVAVELIEQSRARLSAGATVAEVLTQCGEPPTVARRLRLEKLRQRPLWWRAFRASYRVTKWLTLSLVIFVGWLQYRYYNIHPIGDGDEVERLDARAAAVPMADRAWHLYAAGIAKVELLPQKSEQDRALSVLILTACGDGPSHPTWPAASDYLTANRAPVDQFLEAAKKPRLGYVRRDPLNDEWLRKLNHATAAEVFRKRPRQGVPLPEISAYDHIRMLLVGSAHEAAVAGDRERALDCLASLGSLSRQIFSDEESTISRLRALDIYDSMAKTMKLLLAADGDSWTEEELLRCLKILQPLSRDAHGEMLSASLQLNRQLLIDLYSSDGRFTREGFEALCAQPMNEPQLAWLADLVQTKVMTSAGMVNNPGMTNKIGMAVVGPFVVPLVAGREKLLKEFDSQSERYLAEMQSQSVGLPAPGGYQQQTDAWLESKTMQIRYFPILHSGSLNWVKAAIERRSTKSAENDGVIVGVACHIYHRRHGAWPDSIDVLVPEILEAVPLDPMDQRPLRLVIIKDRPFVYSVGLDRKDATAKTPVDQLKEIDPGDWQLYPPPDPTDGAEPTK
jgi:hypothetical protein